MSITILNSAQEAANNQDIWVSGAIGVFGAVLGSLVSAYWTDNLTRRNARAAEKQKLSAMTFAAMGKLNHIYSDLLKFKKLFSDAKASMEEDRKSWESKGPQYAPGEVLINRVFFLHSYVQAYAEKMDTIEFSTDDRWAFLRVGGSPLANKTSVLDKKYNSIIKSFNKYIDERRSLQESASPHSADGTTVEFSFNPDNLGQKIQLSVVEDLLNDISDYVDKVLEEAYQATLMLARSRVHPLGEEFMVVLESPSGETVTAGAKDIAPWRTKWWQFHLEKRPKSH